MNSMRRMAITALAAALLVLPAAGRAQEGQGDVIYVPTPQVVVDKMLEMADVGPNDFLIDLGSGDGRIVITAAKRYGAHGIGVDLDPVLIKEARANAAHAGVADHVAFLEQNLFETDLSRASVITSYLLPEMNLKLLPSLMALKPGTRVVTHDYDVEGWYPEAEQVVSVPEKEVGEPGKSYIYFYMVPANIAGRWESLVPVDGRIAVYEFEFDQEFQQVSGEVRIDNRSERLPLFKVHGDRIAFGIDGAQGEHRFEGFVRGGVIKGTVTIGNASPIPWTAMLRHRTEMRTGEVSR